tara:strand:+ start:323 stop:517 length:195 start_codon:yes stop_codon:yes gene_type:complete
MNEDLRTVEITKTELTQIIEKLKLSQEYVSTEYVKGDLKERELKEISLILRKMCILNNKSNTNS